MPEFYHPERETQKHGDNLPHWQQGEVIQFVTFRLADSMPQTKLRQWKEELATWKIHHPEPWPSEIEQEYHSKFTWRLETWLDEGYGSCIFNDANLRQLLQDTLMHDQATKAIHHAFVIMPNHVQPPLHTVSSVGETHAIMERRFISQDRTRHHLAEKLP